MKDFADLKSLGKQLKEQAEVRAVAEKERVQQVKKQAVEANIFHTALGGVKRMPASAARRLGVLPSSKGKL